MITLRNLHKFHNDEEFEHVFTEEELNEIEKTAKEKNIRVQQAVREFAKSCTWTKIG